MCTVCKSDARRGHKRVLRLLEQELHIVVSLPHEGVLGT